MDYPLYGLTVHLYGLTVPLYGLTVHLYGLTVHLYGLTVHLYGLLVIIINPPGGAVIQIIVSLYGNLPTIAWISPTGYSPVSRVPYVYGFSSYLRLTTTPHPYYIHLSTGHHDAAPRLHPPVYGSPLRRTHTTSTCLRVTTTPHPDYIQ